MRQTQGNVLCIGIYFVCKIHDMNEVSVASVMTWYMPHA